MFYRDGLLYGHVLNGPLDPDVSITMQPTIWSTAVIQYSSKVHHVEAIQLGEDNVGEIARWCGGVVIDLQSEASPNYVGMNVPTIDGGARAEKGDYILKDENGRFGVMSEQDFVKKYEVA